MTENNNQINKEIDLFELIEIVFKRKYLIISIIMISVLTVSFYVYLLRPDVPKRYSINMVLRYIDLKVIGQSKQLGQLNGNLSKFRDKIINDTVFWFNSWSYKADLQEKLGLVDLPDVTCERKGGFLNLNMTYPVTEDGKRMLTEVFEIFLSSDIFKHYQDGIEKSFEKTMKEIQLERNNENKKIVAIMDILKDYLVEIEDTDKRISNLQQRMKQLEKQRITIDSNHSKSRTSLIKLYDDYKDTIIKYINDLEKQIFKIKSSIRFVNIERNELDKKIALQQIEIENLDKEMGQSNKILDTEKPYYEELPLKKRFSNLKIIGFTTALAAFIGIVIAFLMGIRDRQQAAVMCKE